MRTLLAITQMVFVTVTIVYGQQTTGLKPSVSDLLAKIQSPDGDGRVEAFYQLRSSPEALRSSKVRAALLDLLDRENQASDKVNRSGGAGENEGDDEYMGDLVSTVASFADWNDARQACIIAASGALSVDKYAEHAKVAIPCFLKRSKSNFGLERRQGVELLVEVLANKKTDLDPSTIQTCKQVVQMALNDPDAGVRIGTVHALAEFGGEDMIPALRQVSESDPYVDKENHSFWIREYATQAIDAIEQRAGKR